MFFNVVFFLWIVIVFRFYFVILILLSQSRFQIIGLSFITVRGFGRRVGWADILKTLLDVILLPSNLAI